jgi:formylmethanofuran dehydrogenase subunit E
MDITPLLEKSMQDHDHLCPRQILGVHIGLAGMRALGFNEPPTRKQLLAISETDGCFVDGVIAATDRTSIVSMMIRMAFERSSTPACQ